MFFFSEIESITKQRTSNFQLPSTPDLQLQLRADSESSSLLSLVARQEPSLLFDRSSIRDFGAFLVSVDTRTRLPRWVLQRLTPESLDRDGPTKRPNHFLEV
jgi:hypothetical protein